MTTTSIFTRPLRWYWRLKYRPGSTFTVWIGHNDFWQILIVENRIKTYGTLIYRKREVFVPVGSITWARAQEIADRCEYGPLREDTVPDMFDRLTNG